MDYKFCKLSACHSAGAAVKEIYNIVLIQFDGGKMQSEIGIRTLLPAENHDSTTVFLRDMNMLSIPQTHVLLGRFDQRIYIPFHVQVA